MSMVNILMLYFALLCLGAVTMVSDPQDYGLRRRLTSFAEPPVYSGMRRLTNDVPVYGGMRRLTQDVPVYGGMRRLTQDVPVYGGMRRLTQDIPVYGGMRRLAQQNEHLVQDVPLNGMRRQVSSYTQQPIPNVDVNTPWEDQKYFMQFFDDDRVIDDTLLVEMASDFID
eukprot:TRINITY_DN9337_c0_g2_i1.p2 TRINITY_DN9337_c0_g2~~TRINITY_DN9337_c0_g2_i1.p2  ORF type:complete len:169 (+),score=21.57 TRINITY_DN9337_c0_g2_i1:165-671(+)